MELDNYSIRLATSQLSHRQSRIPLVLTPKRHSARIEKPRSVHHSPRVPERRRTFTSSKQFASLEDHYRAMFGDSNTNEQESQSHVFSESVRPVSWHPSSARFSGSNSQTSHANASTSSHDLSTTQEPSHLSDGSQHSTSTNGFELTVTNNNLQSLGVNSISSSTVMDEGRRSQDEVIWTSYFGNNMPVTSGPTSYPSGVLDEPMSWPIPDISQPYVDPPQYQQAPTDFLSIQHSPPELQDSEGEEDNQLEKQKSRELIGMGLYDPPGSTPPSFGFGREGKGLKLEEEWEPPELPDDDDDIDNEADQESSADEEETPDPPKAQEQQWGMQASILPPSTNVSGKTFFFDDDDTITNEWWYQQLKKPTVQDAGIGYGWLQHA
jgi:hypothetical protein